MLNFRTSFIDYIHENIDPSYAKEREKNKKGFQLAELISAAALVTSVAFAIFGFALTLSGGLGAFVGLPLILVSLPISYLSYNAYRMSENLLDIVDNPKKYQHSFGFEPTFDKHKIKSKLAQGTICFRWYTDFAADEIVLSSRGRLPVWS